MVLLLVSHLLVHLLLLHLGISQATLRVTHALVQLITPLCQLATLLVHTFKLGST